MHSGSSLWDAIIVGGGPAGATAALELARHGLRVAILEKESWPRYKTCGGGLVWRARRQLDMPMVDAIDAEARVAELHSHDLAATFSVSRPHPLVSMTMRSALDDLLTTAAVQIGAEMHTSCEVTHIDRRGDHLSIVASGRSFQSRYLVAADGAAGATAPLTGWRCHPILIPALESEIHVDQETFERFSGIARFDFGLIPAGYAWVFPKRETLSVGCLSWQRQKPGLKKRLANYLDRLDIRPQATEDHGFVIPVAPRARRLASERVLLTGDSAGLADPVTCEGISNAILSGRLAAAAIADHTARPERVVQAYQDSLETYLLKELRAARWLAKLLYERPRLRRFAFRRLGQPLSEAMAEIISGELEYRDLLTRPSTYWRALTSLLG